MIESISDNRPQSSPTVSMASSSRLCWDCLRRWIVGKRASWLVVALAAALLGSALWSYHSGGIIRVLLTRGISAGERVTLIQEYFESLGVVAPLAYVAIVTIEVVVAPIPGLMLYAPGGLVFGGFGGGLLSLLGNVLGAGIACGLIRVLGGRRFASWLEQGRLRDYRDRLAQSGLWVVLLLRINPLTSSDLVSYAAGLAGISVWKVMIGTLLGMAPLCWAQAYLSEGILTALPQLIYPLVILCMIYLVVVVWVVARMSRGGKARGLPAKRPR